MIIIKQNKGRLYYTSFIIKLTGGKFIPGKNLVLPPPLNALWGDQLLKTAGTEMCSVSVFPIQNTNEYPYDDPKLVEQYCNLANTVFTKGTWERSFEKDIGQNR